MYADSALQEAVARVQGGLGDVEGTMSVLGCRCWRKCIAVQAQCAEELGSGGVEGLWPAPIL